MQQLFGHIDIELPWSGTPVPVVLVLLVGAVLLGAWLHRQGELSRFGKASLALVATGLCLAALTGRLGWVYVSSIRVTRFGAFLLVGLVVGSLLAFRRWRSAGLSRERWLKVLLTAFAFGLVGAKLSYGISHWEDYAQLEGLWSLRSGGLEGFGALIGGSLGVAWAVRDQGEELWRWLDGAAPGIAFGAAIVSVGATRFQVASPAFASAIFALILGALLLVSNGWGRPSSAFLVFGLLYGTFGVLVDIFARGPTSSQLNGLSVVGWACVGSVIGILVLARHRSRKLVTRVGGADVTNNGSPDETGGGAGAGSTAVPTKARSQRE